MKIYFAGPDVFRPDADILFAGIRACCCSLGVEPLIPVDGPHHDTPGPIFAANVEMIRAADLIVANLNPFRGFEADAGTVWEVGFGFAIGRPVIGYLSDGRDMVERNGDVVDSNGWHVENFGSPLNLMLSQSVRQLVKGDVFAALSVAATLHTGAPRKLAIEADYRIR